jgi:hypothetical protein
VRALWSLVLAVCFFFARAEGGTTERKKDKKKAAKNKKELFTRRFVEGGLERRGCEQLDRDKL